MLQMLKKLPSPAMIVALIALSLALGGVGYAAVALPKNSVGTPQLKKNAVVGSKVKNNSLSGADIKEGTLKIPGVAGSITIAGVEFQPRDGTGTYGYGGNGSIYGVTGTGHYTAPVRVPQGATITLVTFYLNDANAANINCALSSYAPSTAGLTDHGFASSAGAGGLGAYPTAPLTVQVDNTMRDYRALCAFGANASDLALQGVRVDYTFKATLKTRPTTRLKNNVTE